MKYTWISIINTVNIIKNSQSIDFFRHYKSKFILSRGNQTDNGQFFQINYKWLICVLRRRRFVDEFRCGGCGLINAGKNRQRDECVCCFHGCATFVWCRLTLSSVSRMKRSASVETGISHRAYPAWSRYGFKIWDELNQSYKKDDKRSPVTGFAKVLNPFFHVPTA